MARAKHTSTNHTGGKATKQWVTKKPREQMTAAVRRSEDRDSKRLLPTRLSPPLDSGSLSADAQAGDEHSELQGEDAAGLAKMTDEEFDRLESEWSPITEDEDEGMEKPDSGQQESAAGEFQDGNEKIGPVPDLKEIEEVGRVFVPGTIWKDPAALPDQQYSWPAAKVSLTFTERNLLVHGSALLIDSENRRFGRLETRYGQFVDQLFQQRHVTGLTYTVKLPARPLTFGESRFNPSTVDVCIDIHAWRHAVREIQGTIKAWVLELRPITVDAQKSQTDVAIPVIDRSVAGKDFRSSWSPDQDAIERADFEAEASKHKADSRVDRENDFEPTHPAKTSNSVAAVDQMELEDQQAKTLTPFPGHGAQTTTTTKPAPENAQGNRARRDDMPSPSATTVNEASKVAQISSGRATPDVPLQQTSAQAACADVQHQIMASISSVADDKVAEFLEYTDTTSEEEARQYILAHGSVPRAVRQFIKDQKALILKDATPSHIQPASPTLLEEALKAHSEAKDKRDRQLYGDTVVILDGTDLGRICRLNFSDLRKASKIFDAELSSLQAGSSSGDTCMEEAQGVRHLYILLQPIDGQMPKLMRKNLSTRREECAQDMFRRAEKSTTTRSSTAESLDRSEHVSTNVKPEHDGTMEATESPSKSMDSQAGYEDFFCLVSRFRPKFCEAKDIASVIGPLEAVAEIANHYKAVHPTSEVTIRLNDLFNRFVIEGQLWQSIAVDASRWLMIAVQLKNVPIFKESFVHLAGSYPDWLGSVPQTDFPTDLMESIEIKSSMLREERMKIERQLMFTTLYGYSKEDRYTIPVSQHFRPSTYHVVNLWSDWIKSHLSFIDPDSNAPATRTRLCKHDDGKACLNLAGFYTKLSLGGGHYLPINDVIKNWNGNFSYDKSGIPKNKQVPGHSDWEGIRIDLAALKDKASKLVRTLVKKNLEYKEKLGYLTCIEVEDSDIPWEKE